MRVKFKLKFDRSFQPTLKAEKRWNVLLADGGQFDLYHTVLREWFTSHEPHMRHPNKNQALIEGFIYHYRHHDRLAEYRKCRGRAFVYNILRPQLTPN